MYRRKASLDQRPIIIMTKTGHSPRNIAIAAPDLMEWHPISSALNPRRSSPTAVTAHRRAVTSSSDAMCSIRPFLQTAETGVLSDDPGYFLIRWTKAAHCTTGHNVASLERRWVTVSILMSFFCHSNVMDT